MSAYDDVVAALPHLSPAECERVSERLRVLRSLAPGSRPPATTLGPEPARPGDELLEAISAAAQRLSGERANMVGLRRSAAASAFYAKAEAVEAFALQHAPQRVARRALLALGVELLYRELASQGLSVSTRAMMRHVHRLPAVLDAAFPGYARAGLLGMVVGSKGRL